MILIVGGAGYIGSHTNKALYRRGYETLILDNLTRGHREFVKWGTFIAGDLRDEALLERIFSEYPIEAVLHFAAYAYVGESVTKPAQYYRNNVSHTLHLLDAMARYRVQYLIFSSSCATYGAPETMPIDENAVQRPVNPYGRSKLMAEWLMEDYGCAYGLNTCALRYFNAAGADPEGEVGEWHEPETHLIPLVLAAALGRRRSVSVFGTDYPTPDGTCVRDYIHVNDLAEAHIRALEYIRREHTSECFNLGNGQGYSVREIIAAARQVTGKEIPVQLEARRAGDPPILVGGAAKARRLLGWEPQFDLRRIVETAWQWQCARETQKTP